MRKRWIGEATPERRTRDGWMDVERIATAEVTSENPAHPIERALLDGHSGGWQASSLGPQTIRLRFDAPVRIRRILIEIIETTMERTQELTLSWSREDGKLQEIVRQQWNFSPRGSTLEREELQVDLESVSVLQLTLQPDIRGPSTHASIATLRIA